MNRFLALPYSKMRGQLWFHFLKGHIEFAKEEDAHGLIERVCLALPSDTPPWPIFSA